MYWGGKCCPLSPFQHGNFVGRESTRKRPVSSQCLGATRLQLHCGGFCWGHPWPLPASQTSLGEDQRRWCAQPWFTETVETKMLQLKRLKFCVTSANWIISGPVWRWKTKRGGWVSMWGPVGLHTFCGAKICLLLPWLWVNTPSSNRLNGCRWPPFLLSLSLIRMWSAYFYGCALSAG